MAAVTAAAAGFSACPIFSSSAAVMLRSAIIYGGRPTTAITANFPLLIGRRYIQSTTAGGSSKRAQAADSWGKRLLVGFGIGALIGGGYAIYKNQTYNTGVLMFTPPGQIEVNRYQLDKVPDFPISRSVRYPGDTSGLKLTLYQYQTCPFCCKVRTLLDYLGVSYDVVEVNPVLRSQLKWSDNYRKVPILIVESGDGEIIKLTDSSMIVSTLYSFLQEKTSTSASNQKEDAKKLSDIAQYYPTSVTFNKEGKEETDVLNKYYLMYGDKIPAKENQLSKEEQIEERKWRQWADSVYVHTLSPNIYRTMSESLDSFRYFDKVGEWDKNFSQWERTLVIYVGATAMWLIGKRLQKRHNLNTDVRQSLYEESNVWMNTIKKKGAGDFMGGNKPNLADLAVFGVLSSIEGCQAFGDLNNNSTIVNEWYFKVKQTLQQPEEIRA